MEVRINGKNESILGLESMGTVLCFVGVFFLEESLLIGLFTAYRKLIAKPIEGLMLLYLPTCPV